MYFRWRRVALWVFLAPCFFLACSSISVGGSRSRGRSSNAPSLGKQAAKVTVAAFLLMGPDLIFRRDGVAGKAVVRGGWPFVVDYELEQTGHLRLTITPKSGAAKSYRIPEFGTAPAGSRQEDVIRLSRDLGDAIQEGSLSLRAYVGEAEDQPVPFKTYGLGAGDQAVGSMTVVDVRFSPSEIDVKRGQRADFSYMLRRSFNQVRVQIDRLDDSTGAPTPIFRKDVRPTPGRDQERKDSWDGRDDKNRKSKGLHRLQVTAWFGPNVEAWNTALSGTMVRVRP